MNRRTFLKWLGATGVVAATTDPLELLAGSPETEDVSEEPAYYERFAGMPVTGDTGVMGMITVPYTVGRSEYKA